MESLRLRLKISELKLGWRINIDGKEELTAFLTQWFEGNEQVSVFPEWGVPLKFINQEENQD